MISSISLRSPRKTCGLFDTGFAGGDLDVTSLDLNAPADLIGNPYYSLESLKTVNFLTSEPDTGSDAYAEGKLDSVQQYTMDTFDFLDPLADLETDQLMDDSLDAFVNLDQFLMGDTFFDETAEVKPLADVYTDDSMTLTALDTEFFLPPELAVSKSRKRKAEPEPLKIEPIKTSMFEIPTLENVTTLSDPQLDHDYTAKHQRISTTIGSVQKLNHDTSNCKEKPAAKIVQPQYEPSTSFDDITSFTEEIVTDKQAFRRLKNNVASKKSREQRKQKFADLDNEAEILIQANEELRRKIVELEKTAKEMKALLVAKMTGH